jgi:hypothetical protein
MKKQMSFIITLFCFDISAMLPPANLKTYKDVTLFAQQFLIPVKELASATTHQYSLKEEHDSKQDNDILADSQKNNYFTCCGRTFFYKKSLILHQESHSRHINHQSHKIFTCKYEFCKKPCIGLSELRKHYLWHQK